MKCQCGNKVAKIDDGIYVCQKCTNLRDALYTLERYIQAKELKKRKQMRKGKGDA